MNTKVDTVGEDGIYFPAAENTYTVPSELERITKTRTSSNMTWIVNPEDVNLSRNNWQSDPSRIIYHGGRFHMWMIDLDRAGCAEGQYWANPEFFNTPEGREFRPTASRILYLSSEDTHHWTAHGHLPLGPEGSCYDLLLEQPNVVFHEGKFYLFTEAWSTNIEKYGHRMAGITCLVADSPAGPWTNPPGVDVLVKPEMDGESWESARVLNPRHIYHNGKWFMYYKGIREGAPTENGLAVADTITGPYRKYEGNPVLKGHGHFCWRYKHGMIMIPNYGDMEHDQGEQWIHWSEDGIHFAPIEKSNNVFVFGSLYVPYDSLSGDPSSGDCQAEESTTVFWGFESVKPPSDRDWDVERIEWTIGNGSGGVR
jgi:hypothetical protein